MGRVVLTRDPRTRLFALPAFAQLGPRAAPRRPGSSPIVPFEMYLDSGSSHTLIAEVVADQLGIDTKGLSRGNSAGIGGFAHPPVLPNFEFFVQDSISTQPFQIRLPEVSIMEDRRERRKAVRSSMKGTVEQTMFGMSLFGLDALEYLRATFTLQPHTNTAFIEWE